ncbi:hypothetical protein BCR39DRAFT_559802 [Naematelia encephala]|uniref:Xylanolytic transcriptional activator regulatory domain-containing protein n=1 Tax=Naematelia encephala TaxID=71784 RepID=A0A1Y2AZB0_9TREE|nr:hypothetical protein BCR39DRAFT_559802 [Naematelia encephala]
MAPTSLNSTTSADPAGTSNRSRAACRRCYRRKKKRRIHETTITTNAPVVSENSGAVTPDAPGYRCPTVDAPFDIVQGAINHSGPTIAEMFVSHLLNAEIDLHGTAQLLVASIAEQFGLALTMAPPHQKGPLLWMHPAPDYSSHPARDQAERMVDAYFEYTNCFQPVIDPETVIEDMEVLFPSTMHPSFILPDLLQPDVRIYRLYIILAIGSSLLPKDANRIDTAHLRAWALAHFPAVLRSDEIVVRIVAGLAMGLGYLTDDETLPTHIRERRKRIFWSIYCMDRSISFTLNRPLTIKEEAIRMPLPTMLPSVSGKHAAFMNPVELFRHTVLLRRLQGTIVTELYLPMRSKTDTSKIFANIRNEVDAWYDNIPESFPSPMGSVCKHPYLEVNYRLLLVRLYSPSPILPRTSPAGMSVLRQSAYRVIEMYAASDDGYQMRKNYISVSHIVLACGALLYTLNEGEGDPIHWNIRNWRLSALHQVEVAEQLLSSFCRHLAYAKSFDQAFSQLTSAFKLRLREMDAPPQESGFSSIGLSTSNSPILEPNNDRPVSWNEISTYPADISATGFSNGDFSVDEFLASFGLASCPR